MSTTKIEWCHRPGTKPETWNPTTGCNKVSKGCKNCYAEVMHKRLVKMYPKKYNQPFLAGAVEHQDALMIPFKWEYPRTVFVNSMSDLFHDQVSFEFIRTVFDIMHGLLSHTFIILTKRPHRMVDFFRRLMSDPLWKHLPLPNVWLGVSVEDQQTAGERIPFLNSIPAAVKLISCEPLLGPVDFSLALGHTLKWHAGGLKNCISWVIAGGESGHYSRPMHPDWARSLRDQCEVAGVPFFFKQWGSYLPACQANDMEPGVKTKRAREFPSPHNAGKINTYYKLGKHNAGRLLDGMEHNGFPK